MSQFKVTTNGQSFELEKKDIDLDIKNIAPNLFHLIQDHKSYKITNVLVNLNEQQVSFKLNEKEYSVLIEDEYDQLIHQLGLELTDITASGDIVSPMPGLIIDVLVNEGDTFEKGTPLIVLEAMKMENIIKASGSGKIKTIKISKGDAVKKMDILIEITP